MNKNFKLHRLKNNKSTLKNFDICFFFQTVNINSVAKLEMEQEFVKRNIKSKKMQNSLVKIILKKSIFLNFCVLVNGSICINFYDTNKLTHDDFKSSLNFNETMSFIALKLNKKVYSANQLQNITTLNYFKNIKFFSKTLQHLTKHMYYTLKH